MKNDWEKLVRYVAGEGSSAARERTEQWIREDPARERALRELEALWAARGEQADVDAGWDRVSARLGRVTPHVMPGVPRSSDPAVGGGNRSAAPRRAWLRPTMLAAAAVAGLLIGQVVLNGGDDAGTEWESATAFATDRGELTRLRLSDGTEVVLGVSSRMLVSPDYGGTSREVRLEGDAFFDVAEDADRPFMVHALDARATVLGTSFGVRSRAENGTDVVVTEGRVRVTPEGGAGADLRAGQVAQVARGGGSVDVAEVDPTDHLAWMEGRLVFRDAPLIEVLDHLELWYEVDFRVADDSLAQRRLNVSFERPELDDLLQALMLAVDARYRVDGRTVTFFPSVRHP